MGSRRDEEFAEFLGAAWGRVYRTAYAVAGTHDVTQRALEDTFVTAYLEFAELSNGDDPESDVEEWAVEAVLGGLPRVGGPEPFGPCVPYGALIRALPEVRRQIDATWLALHQQPPETRAAIALEAAEAARGPNPARVIDTTTRDEAPLVEFLVHNLGEVAVGEPDLAAIVLRGRARQRRRRITSAGVAALVVALIAIPLTLWDRGAETPSPPSTGGSWEEVTPAPLTPRSSALVLAAGDKVLVLGGLGVAGCGSEQGCERLTDAAVYEPGTDTWQLLGPIPFFVTDTQQVQRVGDSYVVLERNRWWRYDVAEDQWSRLSTPAEIRPDEITGLTASDSQLFVVGGDPTDQIHVFDVDGEAWSTLPPSTVQPTLERRLLTYTSRGLVVFGADTTAPPDDPFDFPEVFGQLFDGEQWTSFPRSEQRTFACCWWWTGERLVHLERMPVFANEGPGPKAVRFSGGMFYDLEAEGWGYIREAPTGTDGASTGGWNLFAVDGSLMAYGGAIYDDRNGSWATLNRPAQAPESGAGADWVGGQLFAFGAATGVGADFGRSASEATNRAWLYTPANHDLSME